MIPRPMLALALLGPSCKGRDGSLPDAAHPSVDAAMTMADTLVPDAARPVAHVADAAWADAPPSPDCLKPPLGPLPATLLPGFVVTEDLAFDGAGHLIESDGAHIYKTTKTGMRSIFVPNFPFRAGMRVTPAGDLIVNDDATGSLVRIDSDGVRHQVLGGLWYPNGMEIDPDGKVYITEQGANRVLRVDPISGELDVLVNGAIALPNGISFDPFFTSLYIGGFSGEGLIYQLKLDNEGNPGELAVWAQNVGSGSLDGMAVDECGYLYVADYNEAKILRISPFDRSSTIVVDGGESYMPNMQWGSGLGGWDENKLYIAAVDEGLYEVDLGFRSKRRSWP